MAKAKKVKDLDPKSRAKKVKGGALQDEPRRTGELLDRTKKQVYGVRDQVTRKGKGF